MHTGTMADAGAMAGSMGAMGLTTGPVILGFHIDAFLMLASGIIYVLCAIFLWKPMRREKNELVTALFAFFAYQAVNMIFMSLNFKTMDPNFGYISALSILVGSAYMLKFPFSSFSQGVRRAVFGIALIGALGAFAWFMQDAMRQMELMDFTLWYDLAVNGVIVGGFMILLALRSSGSSRIKALGGGTGIASCCVVSNAAMLGGAVVTGAAFSFAAPVLILGSFIAARSKGR